MSTRVNDGLNTLEELVFVLKIAFVYKKRARWCLLLKL